MIQSAIHVIMHILHGFVRVGAILQSAWGWLLGIGLLAVDYVAGHSFTVWLVLAVTLLDAGLQGTEKALVIPGAKAGGGAEVAGRTVGDNFYKQRVVIAVYLQTDQIEEVPTGLSLRPQRLTRTAPEGDVTGVERLLVCFLVHEAQHQHILRLRVLNDGRH